MRSKVDRKKREPDETIGFKFQDNRRGFARTVLTEVEIRHRSFSEAHRWCTSYFRLYQEVNAVVLLEIFSRRSDRRRFAAVGVLYRRHAI